MAQEIMDGKVVGSSAVAKAGLTLGIIGTGLAALSGGNGGNGVLGNLFGGGTSNTELRDQVSQLKSEKYTDGAIFGIYTQLRDAIDATDAKINNTQTVTLAMIADIDKKNALNEQAQRLNREYDNTVRDYLMTIVNNKIDCCCARMEMQANYEKQISELSDASIISYVNSNFCPGILKLPASNISPNVQLA